MREWVKQNKGKLIGIGFVVFVLIPGISYALSTVPLLPIGGNNDWAGFWGGYFGAIFGGLITLYVMFESMEESRYVFRKTLQVEKENIGEERKKRFNDELLEQIVNYYVTISLMLVKLGSSDKSEKLLEEAKNCLVAVELIKIKLSSKTDNPEYLYTKELLDDVKNADKQFNRVLANLKKDKKVLDESLRCAVAAYKKLNDDTMKYYLKNEQ